MSTSKDDPQSFVFEDDEVATDLADVVSSIADLDHRFERIVELLEAANEQARVNHDDWSHASVNWHSDLRRVLDQLKLPLWAMTVLLAFIAFGRYW
jgi:hypothetical protein